MNITQHFKSWRHTIFDSFKIKMLKVGDTFLLTNTALNGTVREVTVYRTSSEKLAYFTTCKKFTRLLSLFKQFSIERSVRFRHCRQFYSPESFD